MENEQSEIDVEPDNEGKLETQMEEIQEHDERSHLLIDDEEARFHDEKRQFKAKGKYLAEYRRKFIGIFNELINSSNQNETAASFQEESIQQAETLNGTMQVDNNAKNEKKKLEIKNESNILKKELQDFELRLENKHFTCSSVREEVVFQEKFVHRAGSIGHKHEIIDGYERNKEALVGFINEMEKKSKDIRKPQKQVRRTTLGVDFDDLFQRVRNGSRIEVRED